MPEGLDSCHRHAFEMIVSVWSGWLFLISQRKITARRRTRAKETQPETIKCTSSFLFAFSSFLMVRGIFRSFLIFSIGRRISRWHAISTFVSGIIMRRPQSSHAELVPGEVRGWGPFRFKSASIKTPRTGRTNCRIYGSLMGRNVDPLNPPRYR